MPDLSSPAGVNSNISNSPSQPQSSAASSSPWDEALPDEEIKPKVMGSLGPETPVAPAPKPVDSHPTFNVPMDIEKDSPLNTIQPGSVSPAATEQGVSSLIQPTASPATPIPKPPIVPSASPLPSAPPAPLPPLPEKPKVDISRLANFSPTNPNVDKVLQKEVNIPNIDAAANMVPKRRFNFAKMMPWIMGLTAIAILSLFVFLTEIGFVSIGLEKVYGAIGLETIWGGLSANSGKALGQSMMAMSQETEYKLKGNITLTIDKTIKSEVTDPLVALNVPDTTFASLSQKAILASSFMDIGDSTTSDLGETSTSTTSTADPTATSQTTTTSSPYTDQSAETSYQNSSLGSSTKQVSADFEGFVSGDGNQLLFNIAKVVGSDKLTLKNSGSNLWVQSDQIKYDTRVTNGQWILYSISSLSGGNIPENLFTAEAANAVTVKGSRGGNEIVGDTRCFNYKIDNIDFGDALAGLGISGETVTLISGNVWIGVRDKLIHKIDLRITPRSTSAVTAIRVNFEISDYGIANSFLAPLSGSTLNTTAGTTSTSASSADLTTIAGRDTKRKSDLVAIKSALVQYKSVAGTYPVATDSVQLLTSGNSLESALVPAYISTLPSDPKEFEGWSYSYKSVDGVSFSLSARMENTSDPEAKLVAGAYLYFLYND